MTTSQPPTLKKQPARLRLEICCPECGGVAQIEDLKPGKSDPMEVTNDCWCGEFTLIVPPVWVKGQ